MKKEGLERLTLTGPTEGKGVKGGGKRVSYLTCLGQWITEQRGV